MKQSTEQCSDSKLSIKDFKVGDVAYVITRNTGRSTVPIINEVSVVKVGRKYVTIGEVWERKYKEWDAAYLLEEVKFGERTLLFKTWQDAEDYLESDSLVLWLGKMNSSQAGQYSLEQLRMVKEILG